MQWQKMKVDRTILNHAPFGYLHLILTSFLFQFLKGQFKSSRWSKEYVTPVF